MASTPSFQFYPNDWLSSTKITLMTPAEEGGYVRLLCYAWNDPDCCLPADEESLMALSRLTDRAAVTKVKKCFIAHPEKSDKITHERLLKERKKQKEWREHQSEAGKKGAKSRWGKKKKGRKGSHDKPIATPMAKNSSSSPSLSSSSTPSSITTSLEEKTSSGKPDHLAFNTFVREVIRHLNTVLKTRYRPTTSPTRALIQARMNQGHTVEEFKIVIDKKFLEWKDDPKMSKFLRPETLFGSKFEGYLNQKELPEVRGSSKTDGNWARLERRREEERARRGLK